MPSPDVPVGLGQSPQYPLLPRQANPKDSEWADALMLQHRAEVGSRKTGACGMKEANPVLSKVVRGLVPNATPGLVQALLDKGANVCIEKAKSNRLINRLTGQDQVDVLSNILAQATHHSPEDILIVLAQQADKRSLNEALPVAIAQRDVVKATILLARGADASDLCTLFLGTIKDGPDEMVQVLLGDVRGACQTCRDNGLVQAATLGYEAKVRILLKKGADATANEAAAVRKAICGGYENVAMEIVSLKGKQLKPAVLDRILGSAYSYKQYKLVIECLHKGAKGTQTATVLAMAVKKQELELVSELIRHGAPTKDSGNSLGLAVQNGRCDLVQMILQCRPQEPILVDAMARATSLASLETIYQMVRLLLSAGLRGDSVSEALIKVVDKASMPGDDGLRFKVVQLLLTKGAADINLHSGRCISTAISSGCVELLPVLLRCKPSLTALSAGLEAAAALPITEKRLNLFGMILKAGQVDAGSDQTLLCAAVSAAARHLLLDDVRALVTFASSSTVCLAGFTAVVSHGDQWLSPKGLVVVKFFLDCGASGAGVDDAFCRAASLFQRDATELLAYSVSREALDRALQGIMAHSTAWTFPENFWLLQLILELGLEMGFNIGSADWALLKAVRAYTEGNTSEDVIDLLLTVGAHADVNFNQGKALEIAARACHAPLLEKLILSGAGSESKTSAFHTAISENLEEDKVEALLDILSKCDNGANNGCDVKATLQSGFPPIAACLSAHPRSVKLLHRLIDLGCELEAKFQWTLYTEKEIGQEAVTVLLWAMGHPKIDTKLIEALINSGPDIDATSSISKSTPLIIAVLRGRKDMVRKLISVNATVTARDVFKRSALFYTSRFGDLESSRELVMAKSSLYEGSLHEAARNLHSSVVRLLIENKHDTNFPSSRHEGRTALQELAYKGDGTASPIRLEETLQALREGRADALTGHSLSGKNALFLALDNPNPYAVTLALLDTIMWRHIANDKNVFTVEDSDTGVKYSYSPTMYITKGYYKGDVAQTGKLLQLLREKGCQDRFFAQSGPQPNDAVGMPDKLRKAEERRRNEEELRRRSYMQLKANSQAEWQTRRAWPGTPSRLTRDM